MSVLRITICLRREKKSLIFAPMQAVVFQEIRNDEKYKPFVLKYKAHILKYMPCIFYSKPCVFFNVPQQEKNDDSDAIFKGIPDKGDTTRK